MNQLLSYFFNHFSHPISASKKGHNTHHLVRGNDSDFTVILFVGSVFMDISKAFNCISLNLIIATLAVRGIETEN